MSIKGKRNLAIALIATGNFVFGVARLQTPGHNIWLTAFSLGAAFFLTLLLICRDDLEE